MCARHVSERIWALRALKLPAVVPEFECSSESPLKTDQNTELQAWVLGGSQSGVEPSRMANCPHLPRSEGFSPGHRTETRAVLSKLGLLASLHFNMSPR